MCRTFTDKYGTLVRIKIVHSLVQGGMSILQEIKKSIWIKEKKPAVCFLKGNSINVTWLPVFQVMGVIDQKDWIIRKISNYIDCDGS